MRRRREAARVVAAVAAVTAAFVASACGHTHDTESANVETHGHATPPKDRSNEPAHAPDPGASPPHDHSNQAEGGPEIPLATSPSGLLVPGAAKRIQARLAAQDLLGSDRADDVLDGPTTQALRRFQHQNGLPATGVPDDATVRKLGLRPEDVFKH